MTQHLDEGAFFALLDGELSGTEESEARKHIAACAVCSAEYEQTIASAALLAESLVALDAPRERKPFVRPSEVARAPRNGWGRAALGRAAALLLAVGAAASATVPGSPVREWLESRLSGDEVAVQAPAAPQPGPEATLGADAPSLESGAGVSPDAGRLRISITGASPGLRLRAVITDSPRGGVFAIGDDAGARFETSPGAVEVTGARMAELRIEIPRSAVEASVTIDGRRYLAKDGDQLRLLGTERTGQELTFGVQP